MKEEPNKWLYDCVNPYFIQMHSIKDVCYVGETRFQSIEIVTTDSFGKCLVLDGKIQSSEADEFIYHEALVHPAMIGYPHPQTVFIAGGGEGATLREVLAHSTVKRVVMVDVDKEAVDICRSSLSSWHQGSFEDSRLELLHIDAREYLAGCREISDEGFLLLGKLTQLKKLDVSGTRISPQAAESLRTSLPSCEIVCR